MGDCLRSLGEITLKASVLHVFVFLKHEAVKPRILCGFVAFWARKSRSEGLREASGGAPEAPEAARRLPIGAKADFE